MNPKKTDPLLKNSLLSLISLMKRKAVERGLKPIIGISKVIDMLKSSGMTITYHQLYELCQDPDVKESISSINKNQITLSTGDEAEEESTDDFTPEDFENTEPAEEPEPTEDDSDIDSGDEPYDYEDENAEEDEDDDHIDHGGENVVSKMAKRAAARS
jgi:hypothetical protein